MNQEMIRSFLNIMEHGNITAAANAAFTTQSSMSKQIRQLEEELGVPLLIRSKGHSSVSLTPYGREFLRLARIWESLMKEFEQIRNTSDITEISIGALDRMNSFTFRDLYKKLLKTHPEIRLDIHTRHSREIYAMMESHALDVGFVSALLPVYNIKARPVYSEPMFVVCSEGNSFGRIIDPDQLDPQLEIYSRWSNEFEIWHDQLWPGKQYRIHVGTTSMTPDYLEEPGRWSIMPVSTLHALLQSHRFTHHALSEEPPQRTIYMLEQKKDRQSRETAISVFKQEVSEYLRNDPYLKITE